MDYAVLEWRNGQPYSALYDDIYYSREDGRAESEYVFLKQNDLPQRWSGVERFVIAETGFGTGLNFVLTVQQWLNTAPDSACLHYFGFEKHPVSPDDLRKLNQHWPDLGVYFEALLSEYPLPVSGQHIRRLFGGRVELNLIYMDVLDALKDRKLAVDTWYLDGFDPAKNTDLWNEDVFQLIANNSKSNTSLSTYTCAGKVRRGLLAVGFEVEKVKGFGAKREMIRARQLDVLAPKNLTPWYQYPSSVEKRDAIIVGAGLAGLSIAWSLLERGWQVTIIDRHAEVAGEASGNLAGLVMPRFSLGDAIDEQFYSSAFLHARYRLNELNTILDKPVWHETGVYLGMSLDKAQKYIKRYGYNQQYFRLANVKDASYLQHVSPDVVDLPVAGWAQPAKICEAIYDVCSQIGKSDFQFIHAEINCMHQESAGWVCQDSHNRQIASASVVVLANGTGANKLASTTWLPLSTIRGQVSVMQANENSLQINKALSFDRYVTPALDGMHVSGASYNLTDTSINLSALDHKENWRRLNNTFPDVFSSSDELNGRVGFRTVSKDRVPVVGALPDYERFQQQYSELHLGRRPETYQEGEYLPGLYISAGHGSRGMSSCFLSAEIIANMVMASPLPVAERLLEYLSPARFLIRQLKRNPLKGQ